MHELRVGDCRILTRSLPANHQSLVELLRAVRRTLRPDGSLWLNLGDSYAPGPLPGGVKKKDLIGIPWMLAFALRQDGWHLRSDIIWTKPNGTPVFRIGPKGSLSRGAKAYCKAFSQGAKAYSKIP